MALAKYDWAANEMKVQLAILDVKKTGVEPTEELIKAAYVKRGGLVYDTNVETISEPTKVDSAPVVKSVRRPRK